MDTTYRRPRNILKAVVIWRVIVDIHGSIAGDRCSLCGALFFVVGVVKTCNSFAEVKNLNTHWKLFIRFVIAKAVVTYGLELMLVIFEILQGVVGTIMRTDRNRKAAGMSLPDAMVTAIEDCGF